MNAQRRFLGWADVYARARPSSPEALGTWLADRGLLGGVADIGAGTGLFTRLLLAHGANVRAIEPNPEMRARLEEGLADDLTAGRFSVHGGSSEATGLPDACMSLVTAAQAAHWFAPEPTVREFRRILKPGGSVLLVWNDWRGEETAFNAAYREVVARFTEDGVPEIATRVPEAELPHLLPGGSQHVAFENPLVLTSERLHALAASVSYLPAPADPAFPGMARALDALFAAHQ